MNGYSALTNMPGEWQQWIADNIKQCCPTESMLPMLIRDGHFPAQVAYDAITEARAKLDSQTVNPSARPQIDLTVNTIVLADKQVEVLFTIHTPEIILFGNVLSNEECDTLIAYAEQHLAPSTVITDHDDGQQLHAARTSNGAMLQRGESTFIAMVEARLAALVNWPVENGEGLQVLKYGKGNEYRPHFDWFDPALPGPRKHLERGGQRVGTIIMYLSDVDAGGSTTFPVVGCQVKPRKGSAVYFANTNAFGVPNTNAYHGGDPVITGLKFIATKWLRARAHF